MLKMKNTGIVRQLDNLGRIVIPMELRKTMGIHSGDPMEVYVSEDVICLKKATLQCALCSSQEELEEIEQVLICRSCCEKIKDKLKPDIKEAVYQEKSYY